MQLSNMHRKGLANLATLKPWAAPFANRGKKTEGGPSPYGGL